MTADEILVVALEKRTPAERAAFLDRECGAEVELRERIERLLRSHQEAGNFLEQPLFDLAPTSAQLPPAVTIGAMIGPYKLLEHIGEGGMGTVYMAEQTEPVKRKVALKLIKAGMDSKQVIARFEAERQALAMMDHVNIARVIDGGTIPLQISDCRLQIGKADGEERSSNLKSEIENLQSPGRPYFVMELVHGVPITKYCDDNHLTPRERLELFVPVCQAIQHAHQKGIIHRDIKPSNVMVTLYDGKPVPKVIDFGVAKATEQKLTERTLFTQYGVMVGTLEYMSPEQAEMSALGVDTRSDIYSLGVLLYELLTGNTPLTHLRMKEVAYAEILRMIREVEPPKPSTRLSDSGEALASISANRHMEPANLTKLVRGELDWIVMKTLDKDRNRRYETAKDFAADVQRYLNDDPVQACPPSALYRFRKFARRNKAAMVTGSVLVLAALSAVGVVAGSLGWMAHEQSVRQGILTHEVEMALQEAASVGDRALTLTDKPYQWEATLATALSALKRAEGLAAQEKAGLAPAVHERLAGLRGRLDADEKDRRFVARVNEIRLEQGEIHEAVSKYKLEIAFPAFNEAFRGHYAIVFGATPPQQVASFLQQRPRPVREYLVAALEASLTHVPTSDPQARQWLGAVLQATDSDPWRTRTRAAAEASDWQAFDKLVKEGIAARQPPVVLIAIADKLPWEAPHKSDLYRHVREAYPGDYWANHSLANVLQYRQKPRLEEAIRYYTSAIAVRPCSPAAYLDLGNAHRSKGELDEALAAYRRAIDIAPSYSMAHLCIGTLLKAKGDRDGARAAYQRSVDVAANRAEAYFQLGFEYHRNEKDLDGAIAAFREATRLMPSSFHAYNNLGYSLLLQGRVEEAIAAYREAVRLEPGNSRYLNTLAWLLATCPEAKCRDPKRAVELAKKAVELVPTDGNQWNTLGVAHYRAGNRNDAVAALDKSMELSKGGNGFDFFFLAMAHWQLGDKNQARKWYDQAVAWMDENQSTDDELRRFRAEAEDLLGVKKKKD